MRSPLLLPILLTLLQATTAIPTTTSTEPDPSQDLSYPVNSTHLSGRGHHLEPRNKLLNTHGVYLQNRLERKCETSSASGLSADVVKIGHFWRDVGDAGNMVWQRNGHGSKCTSLSKLNRAELSLCGGANMNIPASWIAYAASEIAVECAKKFGGKERAGGWYTFKGTKLWLAVH